MNLEVKEAKKAYKQAAKNLMKTIQLAYPVGDVVTCELSGFLIKVEITGHTNAWWCDPEEIYGRNIVTGKHRKFRPHDVV